MPLGIAAKAVRPGIGVVRRVLRSRAGRLGLRPLQLAVILLLVAGGFAVAMAVAGDAREDDHSRQETWAGRAASSLENEVAAAGTILTGTRGLFAASQGAVTAAAFDRFAAIELENSRLQSLNWARRVSAGDRDEFERSFGRPLTESDGRGSIRPAGARSYLYPLVLVAPSTRATRAVLGVNVSAGDPSLDVSLAAARDGGRPVMTRALTLGAGGVPTGVGLVAAIYGPDARPASLAARRAQLLGFTGGLFSIAGLAASTRVILPPGSRLQIVSAGTRVFDSGGGAMPEDASEARVGDTGWTVRVALPHGSPLASSPVLALAGGSLALVLLVGILFAQADQRRRDRDRARRLLQSEADTDGLTGLVNRRRLERDLGDAIAVAGTEAPLALMILDLNGFKDYDDRFGHPAGDALLVRLSARLRDAVPEGRVYRLGGDEFCVLLPIGPVALMEIVGAALAALTEHGEGFVISAAHGVALIPEDATSAEGAMLVADRRMYARKALERESAGNQSADVLLGTIAERSGDLGDHTRSVADLVERVARRLGLDDTERSPVRRAALLHDVGKGRDPRFDPL